ncbi:hypothetical protein QWY89_12785 [Mucilaginibacter myungsuensis]|nr:hypothetical protein [Mucilaginibacter myungsuensis]
MIKFAITLNADSSIFAGHFPGQPVLPGVCMMQMVKEAIETHLGQKTDLVKAADLKFLSMIDPGQTPVLSLEIKLTALEERYNADAKLFVDDVVFFKFKGTFKVQ